MNGLDDSKMWYTDQCLVCSSVNHVFLYHPSPDGWCCWNCNSVFWFDDEPADMYNMVNRSVNFDCVILNGQVSRDG